MGFLYKKSRSEEFGRYFSDDRDFSDQFNQYDIEGKNIARKEKKFNFVKGNIGGLPLSWDEGNGIVFVDHTDSHSLVIGPTGSKKTRLIAMPTVRILGAAGESMIISDPKAEIFSRTADYLKNIGYDISIINLRMPCYSKRWNPLSIPYYFYCHGDMDKACEFANDVAQNIISATNMNSKDLFWEESAASLLFGLILLLFKYCHEYHMPDEDINLKNIFELRSRLFAGSGMQIKNSYLWKYAKQDPFIRNSLIGTVETAQDTRAGILSTFDQAMRYISIQPNLLDMLSVNELDLNQFINSRQALYIIMPDEKTSYHKLVSLFVKQSYEYLIYLAQRDIKDNGVYSGMLPVRINYILDEFSSLPTVADFPAMITAARSRNIRFMLFVQSKHQLIQRYGEETETVMANCVNWIFLTTRELSLLKDISELCGTKDQNPVLSVAHLQRLSKEEGEVLILSGRNKPYIGKLPDIDYYDGGNFRPYSLEKHTLLPDKKLDLSKIEKKFLDNTALEDMPLIDKTGISQSQIDNVFQQLMNNPKMPRFINTVDEKNERPVK